MTFWYLSVSYIQHCVTHTYCSSLIVAAFIRGRRLLHTCRYELAAAFIRGPWLNGGRRLIGKILYIPVDIRPAQTRWSYYYLCIMVPDSMHQPYIESATTLWFSFKMIIACKVYILISIPHLEVPCAHTIMCDDRHIIWELPIQK